MLMFYKAVGLILCVVLPILLGFFLYVVLCVIRDMLKAKKQINSAFPNIKPK